MPHFFRSKKGIFLLTTAVIILLIFLHYVKVLLPVESAILRGGHSIVRLVLRGVDRLADFFILVTSISDLAQENEDLRSERNRLLAENAKLSELEEENQALRDQLHLQEEKEIAGILAHVIVRNPDDIAQSVIIDKGTKDQIFVGAPVIFSEGFLVGRVTESLQRTAKVLLITDQNSVLSGLISESRASGNISGQHGLGLVMDMIPQTDVVNVGDQVITSGLSGELPKGLLIGEVVDVQSSANQLFQKAQVRPYVNFSKLERVFVITDYQKETNQ